MKNTNSGYDVKVIEQYRERITVAKQGYILDDTDENTDEYAHFYFIGKHNDAEVIFDCILYTLRFQHESELFDIAEHKAAQHFPQYNKIQYEEDENGNLKALDDLEEEIGLYMAEVMVELEEEGDVKVKEHVDLDLGHEFGIGLDVGLNVEVIIPELIERFIKDFNLDTLKLDNSLFSFQMNNDDFSA
ncbi:MAG: hypothetical protein ABL895_14970 [Cyclobacteriaceae bacterium]